MVWWGTISTLTEEVPLVGVKLFVLRLLAALLQKAQVAPTWSLGMGSKVMLPREPIPAHSLFPPNLPTIRRWSTLLSPRRVPSTLVLIKVISLLLQFIVPRIPVTVLASTVQVLAVGALAMARPVAVVQLVSPDSIQVLILGIIRACINLFTIRLVRLGTLDLLLLLWLSRKEWLWLTVSAQGPVDIEIALDIKFALWLQLFNLDIPIRGTTIAPAFINPSCRRPLVTKLAIGPRIIVPLSLFATPWETALKPRSTPPPSLYNTRPHSVVWNVWRNVLLVGLLWGVL